ncbi:mannose-6-phosphate isomerase 1 [Micractinium conductrix]|uniref:mannose-6-phosphate isomerase n=1 Tax=Micractinium conductrix TaxID=554055 RepID=A0A2P6V853_9CHLO|nr:mannose-6-phosphate isomerase 1 [Micractinium conductrix]|eukprot:PSC70267.1 mannose-6-phosphate isomerase 1 [Micractinium conductrix]
MGTHPSAPSLLADNGYAGQPLLALLRDRPELLGAALPRFGCDLPFLFKVLSVGTALSIQSHPDKALAERLHAERPEIYKDDNHKPEMALALTEFEALCAFCPHEELLVALDSVPELAECCGAARVQALRASTDCSAARRAALQAAFHEVMACPPERAAAFVERMCVRLQAEAAGGRQLSARELLTLRLELQYPGDVGVLAAWFLNYLRLQPGQAVALPANEPHAYISGEIMECMATSDNVIRAGLTPKLRDTEVLCESLTYGQGVPEVLTGAKSAASPHLALYRPPFREFEMWRYSPPAGTSEALPAAPGPLLLLVQQGAMRVRAGAQARQLKRGDVYFVAAGAELELEASADVTAWVACANSLGFAA